MTPNRERIDKFTRWMLKREAKNRAKGRPGFHQYDTEHECGTPACTGGYLEVYPPFRRWFVPGDTFRWSEFLGVDWWAVFPGSPGLWRGPSPYPKTALQAVNNLRKIAGLPRLTRKDAL